MGHGCIFTLGTPCLQTNAPLFWSVSAQLDPIFFAQIIFPAAEEKHDATANTCALGDACFKAWFGVSDAPREGEHTILAGSRHQVLVQMPSSFIFLFLWLHMFSQMLNPSLGKLSCLSPCLQLCVSLGQAAWKTAWWLFHQLSLSLAA